MCVKPAPRWEMLTRQGQGGRSSGFVIGESRNLIQNRTSRLRITCSAVRDLRLLIVCIFFPGSLDIKGDADFCLTPIAKSSKSSALSPSSLKRLHCMHLVILTLCSPSGGGLGLANAVRKLRMGGYLKNFTDMISSAPSVELTQCRVMTKVYFVTIFTAIDIWRLHATPRPHHVLLFVMRVSSSLGCLCGVPASLPLFLCLDRI